MPATVLAESYSTLMSDPAHLAFELTLEAITGALGLIVGWFTRGRRTKRLRADMSGEFHSMLRDMHIDIDTEHGLIHTDAGIIRLETGFTPSAVPHPLPSSTPVA